jgi:hypothetical protein
LFLEFSDAADSCSFFLVNADLVSLFLCGICLNFGLGSLLAFYATTINDAWVFRSIGGVSGHLHFA